MKKLIFSEKQNKILQPDQFKIYHLITLFKIINIKQSNIFEKTVIGANLHWTSMNKD